VPVYIAGMTKRVKRRLEYFQAKGGPPKYPHVNVFCDEEDQVLALIRVPFVRDCLNAMEAAHISKKEREAFVDAVWVALFREAIEWVTLAHEVPDTD
jgi:hypothetical protein